MPDGYPHGSEVLDGTLRIHDVAHHSDARDSLKLACIVLVEKGRDGHGRGVIVVLVIDDQPGGMILSLLLSPRIEDDA